MKTFKTFVAEKKLSQKDIKRALASIKPPKKKPTLPKAPWDDKAKNEATDAEYHKTLGSTKNSDEGIEALKKKHGMSHDQAKETLKRLMGEEVELDEAEMSLYDKIKAARANPSPDKPVRGRGSKNRNPKTYDVRNTLDKEDDRLQGMVKKKLKKEEVEKVDEVLDRPGALDSYRKKADASGNKARNSATRKILTAPKNGERPDHSAELKTMKKRNRGQDMADRVAVKQFRKSIGLGYNSKKEEVEPVDEISNMKMGQYVRKATDDAARRAMDAGEKAGRGDSKGFGKQMVKSRQRVKGVQKAMDKMDKNRLYGRQ